MQNRLARVAIVGRPNVGKSTLFNRLLGRRRSITLDTPGVTRDPVSASVKWGDRRLELVDTGGLGGESVIELAEPVHQHTLESIEGADLAVVVFDGRAGLNPLDAETVALLGRGLLPVLYVANKVEGPAQEDELGEFSRLGIDPPLAVSAEHGAGIGALKDAILRAIPEQKENEEESPRGDSVCRVAVVGRPNVGKSSLVNRLAGSTLSLVDDKPGTTRDVVDLELSRGNKDYLLLDTAGMRRPSKVDRGVEELSVGRSVGAVRRAQVVLMLIDPIEGVTDQEARIANLAWREGRALVIAVNQCDVLGSEGEKRRLEETFRRIYGSLYAAKFCFMSVLTGEGVDGCFKKIDAAYTAHSLSVRTSELNSIIARAIEDRQPPIIGRGRLKILYSTQTGTRPLTVTLFVNRSGVPENYRRYLERYLRDQFDLEGSPIRLRFSKRSSHGDDRPE